MHALNIYNITKNFCNIVVWFCINFPWIINRKLVKKAYGCHIRINGMVELVPQKLEPWLVLWSFFLQRLLYTSINLPYDHLWNTVVLHGLELLVATWNCWISNKLVPFPCCLSLTLGQNVANLSLFYRYYFGRCLFELAQLVPLPYSQGRSDFYSDRLHDFSVSNPRCYNNIYVNSFFVHTARL